MINAVIWIRTDAALAAYCARWQNAAFVALDTEFIREQTFYAIPGLVQAADQEAAYLIDPLTITNWQPLAQILADTKIVKVLHACGEDLEVLYQLTGTVPEPLCDTQLAAAYLNLGFSMGYARLVAAVLGIDLPKEATRSDWLQRPLSAEQEHYAAADVLYLVQLYQKLRPQLTTDKWAWLLEDAADQAQAVHTEDVPEHLYQEAKLAWKLSRQQLAVLQALYIWRETQARVRNQARNHVLREPVLWSLARTQPSTLPALEKIEAIHPKTIRKDGPQLIAIIQAAGQKPPEEWPEALPKPLPSEARTAFELLRAVGQTIAEQHNMAGELMLRKRTLEALLRSGYPEGPYHLPDSLKGWRRTLMGTALLEVLQECSQ